MSKTTITAGLLLATAFLLAGGMATPAYALMAKHRCYFCHDLHSAAGGSLTNRATSQAVCLACHNVSVDGRTYGTDTDAVSTVAVAVHTGAHFNVTISCLGCHNPHDYEPTDDPATGGVIETNDGDRDPYQNLDLVRRTITVMPFPVTAVFTDITYTGDNSYDYADGGGSGVCQGCHTLTANGGTPRMRNDGSGSGHQLGSNCTGCHRHSNGFDR